MRERSWRVIVRRAGALAIVWVLVAVASWAIASSAGSSQHRARRQVVVTASQASLRLPTLNSKLPAMRIAHRRDTHVAAPHRKSRGAASSTAGATTTTQVVDTAGESAGAGSASSGAASSGSNNVPPTGGAPPP